MAFTVSSGIPTIPVYNPYCFVNLVNNNCKEIMSSETKHAGRPDSNATPAICQALISTPATYSFNSVKYNWYDNYQMTPNYNQYFEWHLFVSSHRTYNIGDNFIDAVDKS